MEAKTLHLYDSQTCSPHSFEFDKSNKISCRNMISNLGISTVIFKVCFIFNIERTTLASSVKFIIIENAISYGMVFFVFRLQQFDDKIAWCVLFFFDRLYVKKTDAGSIILIKIQERIDLVCE